MAKDQGYNFPYFLAPLARRENTIDVCADNAWLLVLANIIMMEPRLGRRSEFEMQVRVLQYGDIGSLRWCALVELVKGTPIGPLIANLEWMPIT